jgi:predicted transcriptional regulator
MPKSVTRTLRLDEDVDAALERMADEAGESVNAIAERALRRLMEWGRFAETAGLVVISPITLGRLMDRLTIEEARALGGSAAGDVFKPALISNLGEVTLTSTLETIRLMSHYMGRFEFQYTTEESKYLITIRHTGGIKWSAFYLGVADAIFGETLGLGLKSSMTEELAMLEFTMPKSSEAE